MASPFHVAVAAAAPDRSGTFQPGLAYDRHAGGWHNHPSALGEVLAAVGTGIVYADEPQITGPAADQARAAAVKAVPGSTAGEVEAETNEGARSTVSSSPNPMAPSWKSTLDKNYKFLGTSVSPDNDEMALTTTAEQVTANACRARRPESAGGRLSQNRRRRPHHPPPIPHLPDAPPRMQPWLHLSCG